MYSLSFFVVVTPFYYFSFISLLATYSRTITTIPISPGSGTPVPHIPALIYSYTLISYLVSKLSVYVLISLFTLNLALITFQMSWILLSVYIHFLCLTVLVADD